MFESSAEEKPKINCRVVIDQSNASITSTGSDASQHHVIGSITVPCDTSWQQLEESLARVVMTHLRDVTTGLKPRKLVKGENVEGDAQPCLGLSMGSVKYFSIGSCFLDGCKLKPCFGNRCISPFSREVFLVPVNTFRKIATRFALQHATETSQRALLR